MLLALIRHLFLQDGSEARVRVYRAKLGLGVPSNADFMLNAS